MAYTYLIGWKKQNKFYYGARWAKNCKPTDLWCTYFTSSKHVKSFYKENGDPDVIQIRKIFDDSEKCKAYERRVLLKLNVLQKDMWLNKNINGQFLPSGPQSTQHITKRIEKSIATKIKNGTLHSPAWTAKTHPEYAKRVSLGLKGKAKTPDHVAAMKKRFQNTAIITCPYCLKTGDYKNMHRWHMGRCKFK